MSVKSSCSQAIVTVSLTRIDIGRNKTKIVSHSPFGGKSLPKKNYSWKVPTIYKCTNTILLTIQFAATLKGFKPSVLMPLPSPEGPY